MTQQEHQAARAKFEAALRSAMAAVRLLRDGALDAGQVDCPWQLAHTAEAALEDLYILAVAPVDLARNRAVNEALAS